MRNNREEKQQQNNKTKPQGNEHLVILSFLSLICKHMVDKKD